MSTEAGFWAGFACVSLLLMSLLSLRTFYAKVRWFPRGPVPLPLVGNVFAVRRWAKPLYEMGPRLRAMYGDPCTIWLAWIPVVVVNDVDNLREASVGAKRNHFAERLQLTIGTIQKRGNEDVVFGKFGPEWEALRKVFMWMYVM